MTDIRSQFADALRESLAPWMTGFCEGIDADIIPDALLLTVDDLSDDIAGELLSLPGIAIIDAENVEAAAQALYRDYDDGKTPMNFPWEAIPEVSRENFRRITSLVLAAAGVQAQEEQ